MDASGLFMSEIEKLARLTVQSPERQERWEAAKKAREAEKSQTGESKLRVQPGGRQEKWEAAAKLRGEMGRPKTVPKEPAVMARGKESAPSSAGPGWWGRRSRLQKGLMVGAPATAAAATGAAALIRHLSKRKKAE